MYIHLLCCEQLRLHSGFGHAKYRLFHILPARVAELFPQSPLRPLPVRLSDSHLSLACSSQAEQPLPPVSSAPGANPALFPQSPHGSRQSRTIHGKAGAQALLINLSRLGQRGEQTELRDLKTCPPQFRVVNPRHDSAEAAKVLTRAWQLKKYECQIGFPGTRCSDCRRSRPPEPVSLSREYSWASSRFQGERFHSNICAAAVKYPLATLLQSVAATVLHHLFQQAPHRFYPIHQTV